MTLIEYLRERHKTVNALTRKEAAVIGIDYPLQGGWVGKYGKLELPEEIVKQLRTARQERYQQKSYKKAKNRAKAVHKAKPAKAVNDRPFKRTKKDKLEERQSMMKLVKNIVAQGCTDAEKLIKHLNKPSKSVALFKMHKENMKHMASI